MAQWRILIISILSPRSKVALMWILSHPRSQAQRASLTNPGDVFALMGFFGCPIQKVISLGLVIKQFTFHVTQRYFMFDDIFYYQYAIFYYMSQDITTVYHQQKNKRPKLFRSTIFLNKTEIILVFYVHFFNMQLFF